MLNCIDSIMHLSCFVHMHACRNIADVVTDHIGDGHDDDHIGDVMAYCTCAW